MGNSDERYPLFVQQLHLIKIKKGSYMEHLTTFGT